MSKLPLQAIVSNQCYILLIIKQEVSVFTIHQSNLLKVEEPMHCIQIKGSHITFQSLYIWFRVFLLKYILYIWLMLYEIPFTWFWSLCQYSYLSLKSFETFYIYFGLNLCTSYDVTKVVSGGYEMVLKTEMQSPEKWKVLLLQFSSTTINMTNAIEKCLVVLFNKS